MMQQHIDRSRQTTGGMTASFVLHAGLLFLLTVGRGRRRWPVRRVEDELMEIAYIEARYGEDVAAKVKLKETPWRPEPRGTRRQHRQRHEAGRTLAVPPRPEPKPLTRPELPVTEPAARQQVAEVAAPTIEPVAQQPQTLAQAPALEAKAPRPQARQVIDASQVARQRQRRGHRRRARAPARATARPQGQFKPQEGALKSKAGGIVAGGEVVASAGRPRRTVRRGRGPGAGGCRRRPRKQQSRHLRRRPVRPWLRRASGGGKAGGKGVLDVTGPSGGGGGKGSGRKTILNYGSGSGGRGGWPRPAAARLAEPEPTSAIVKKAEPAAEPKQAGGRGQAGRQGRGHDHQRPDPGRKILKSVAPEYTAKARQKGWEGVVAVHFTVLADGRVKDNTYFEQTSVHRDLNQMALKAIKKFRFAPLPADQAAVEQWGVITIVFRLN